MVFANVSGILNFGNVFFETVGIALAMLMTYAIMGEYRGSYTPLIDIYINTSYLIMFPALAGAYLITKVVEADVSDFTSNASTYLGGSELGDTIGLFKLLAIVTYDVIALATAFGGFWETNYIFGTLALSAKDNHIYNEEEAL